MSKALFDADSGESDSEIQLGTNKEYAKTYNTFRQKELLKKLKDRQGDDSDSDSETDSSDDDDEANNPKFDDEFYRALASLKEKDPKIYDKNLKFFDEPGDSSAQGVKEKKPKALTVKDYERKVLLEKGGIYVDDEEDDETDDKRPQSPTYVEEQKSIKNEFKRLIDDDSDDGEAGEDWGGIFKKREQTKEEKEEESAEHEKWLADPANADDSGKSLKPLKEYWSNPKLSKDEIFLRDYILSNGYADRDVDEIPTYDEIVGGSDNEDDFEQKQIEFEHKYNFRFEDPDTEFIKRYPRTIEQSVRKTDDRRKLKRVEVRDRKQKEKEEKLKEIDMLKEMKRNEIEEKIRKLKEVTGDENLAFQEIDLNEDFDPEAYDKRMQAIFNSEYYQVDEGEEKPEAPSDIEDLQVENYDEYDQTNDLNVTHCEDDTFNMDCDYDPVAEKKSFQQELIENTRDKRKRRKRKSKFMEMLERDRPKFDEDSQKTYSQYLDEYYKLDCEDVIGDVQCRFKYVETEPNDFGLSVEEILMAKNKELNAWASMKKTTQIRPDHVDRNEQEMFRRKARNDAIKRKILCSLYEVSDDEPEPEVITVSNPVTIAKEQNKKKKKKNVPTSTVVSGALANENQESLSQKVSKINTKEKPNKKEQKTEIKSTEETKEASIETPIPIQSQVTANPLKRNRDNKSEKPSMAKKQKACSGLTPVAIKAKQNGTPTVSKKQSPLVKKTNSVAQNPNKIQLKFNSNKPFNTRATKPFNNKFQKPHEKTKIRTNGLSDERLKAFGINPKKFQKQLKYGPGAAVATKGNSTTGVSNGISSKKSLAPKQSKAKNGPNKDVKDLIAHKNKLKKFLNKKANSN